MLELAAALAFARGHKEKESKGSTTRHAEERDDADDFRDACEDEFGGDFPDEDVVGDCSGRGDSGGGEGCCESDLGKRADDEQDERSPVSTEVVSGLSSSLAASGRGSAGGTSTRGRAGSTDATRSARGIPDFSNYGDHTYFSPGDVLDLFVQEHNAQRAGRHFDVRIGKPGYGLLSWATRRGFPAPGERSGFYRTPLHAFGYGQFEGTLHGYGAGTVRVVDRGKLIVTKVTPNAIAFVRADKRFPERYVLFRPKSSKRKGDWIIANVTPKSPLPYSKLHFSKLLPEALTEEFFSRLGEEDIAQTKYDGASSLIQILPDGGIEVYSYRIGANGRPIVHTERIFGGPSPKLDIPRELAGTVLRGELLGYRKRRREPAGEGESAEQDGEGVKAGEEAEADAWEVIPPQELGALLNSTLENSLRMQKDRGIRIRNAIFDIQQYGKQPVDMQKVPYSVRRKMLEEILPYLPSSVFFPSEAVKGPGARKLWETISSGKHPEGHREGVVFYLSGSAKPTKAKTWSEYDVYIRRIFPGAGKYRDRAAGGFAYSLTPDGPIVGEVGTGFDDDMRRMMWESPDAFVGRVARVRAQEQYPSGALRAPSFIALHEDI